MGTGVITVKSLHVPACHKLAAFLSDPKNRSPEGYLMIKQKPFPGYDQYNRVHGIFHPMLQAVQTTQVQGKESIAFALTGLPPLGELFVMVLQELRVPVHTLRNMSPAERQTAFHTSFFPLCRAIHFLRQDQHANALFKWPADLMVVGPPSAERVCAATAITAAPSWKTGEEAWVKNFDP